MTVNSGRKNGRPRKGDPPRVPYDELDRLLVFGEVVPTEDGDGTTVIYPSYRDLARRYNVSNSLIAEYSKKHDCQRRRALAKARVIAKADQKLVELRATAIALTKDDELRIIDTYLAGFEKALADERVRFDNPGDFNTMVRLKEFVQGGADSRKEIHASLSLEDIQARHRRMMKTVHGTTAAECGEVDKLRAFSDADRSDSSNPPARSFQDAPGEPSGQPDLSDLEEAIVEEGALDFDGE